MVEVTFNGKLVGIVSVEDLDAALHRFDLEPRFELSVSVETGRSMDELPDGPVMSMLRNGPCAWLMYLRYKGDSGFVSRGDVARIGKASYTLSNGQVDEYPLSWCIDLEQCYRAIAYFFVNEGRQPGWITWHDPRAAPNVH